VQLRSPIVRVIAFGPDLLTAEDAGKCCGSFGGTTLNCSSVHEPGLSRVALGLNQPSTDAINPCNMQDTMKMGVPKASKGSSGRNAACYSGTITPTSLHDERHRFQLIAVVENGTLEF